jgi:plasmid stability protein
MSSTKMRNLMVRDIDEAMLDRIRVIAIEQGCSTNEIAVRALRYALGLSDEELVPRDRQDIATMRGIWNQSESQAFREAMDAFRQVESGPLFEPDKDPKK